MQPTWRILLVTVLAGVWALMGIVALQRGEVALALLCGVMAVMNGYMSFRFRR